MTSLFFTLINYLINHSINYNTIYNTIRGNYVKSKPTDSVEFLSLQNLDKGWFQGNQPKKGFSCFNF